MSNPEVRWLPEGDQEGPALSAGFAARSSPRAVRDALSREVEFRRWLASFPELFQTSLHQACFLQIALLTLDGDRLASLKLLYRKMPHSENAVRAYLRSLANGSWIRLERAERGDRRIVGLTILPRFKEARDAYFARVSRAAADRGAPPIGPSVAALRYSV